MKGRLHCSRRSQLVYVVTMGMLVPSAKHAEHGPCQGAGITTNSGRGPASAVSSSMACSCSTSTTRAIRSLLRGLHRSPHHSGRKAPPQRDHTTLAAGMLEPVHLQYRVHEHVHVCDGHATNREAGLSQRARCSNPAAAREPLPHAAGQWPSHAIAAGSHAIAGGSPAAWQRHRGRT